MKNTANAKPRLFQKDFTLVVIGQIISLFGNSILRFAMPLYILQESGSAAVFGLVSASAFLPMLIMSPIGGILADRVNKQRIMVVLDTVTAALIAAFMVLSGKVSLIPLVVVTLMVLYGIQGAYTPAVKASIPLLAKGDLLVPANAAVNLVQSLSELLGPVAGGMLYGSFGLWPIVAVSGVCFALSAVIELFIRIPYQKPAPGASVWAIVRDDMSRSIRFIVKENPLMARVILIIFCINLFMSSMLNIGMPVIITSYLGLSSELYGLSQGILAAGGLAGGLCAGLFAKRLNVANTHILLILCAAEILPIGISLLLGLPAVVSFWVLSCMGCLLMACATLFSIQMLSFLQAQTPPDIIGKVVSCVMAISICSQPIGQALYGMLFESFAALPWVVVLGSGLISLVVAFYSKASFKALAADAAPAA
ncbi:MFS transporter [Ruminococcaceae bacterium OttesenSCG-928-L11]|nr:MFS transporter [Ruminococcaceae bacterium OttesenSCG-928-L11]